MDMHDIDRSPPQGTVTPAPKLRVETGSLSGTLLSLLRCPSCAAPFDVTAPDSEGSRTGYAVLTCACRRYPLIAHIPILDAASPALRGHLLELIESRRYRRALVAAITSFDPSAVSSSRPLFDRLVRLRRRLDSRGIERRAEQLLRICASGAPVSEMLSVYFARRPGRNYFVYRFTQPRHLVTLSLMSLVRPPRTPLLDVACGAGHMTRFLIRRAHGQPVIGLDRNFFMLYVAKNYIAPEADYVCCDVQPALPFSDSVFSFAVCSNAFHEFSSKVTVMRELRRATNGQGAILLTGIQNPLVIPRSNGLRPDAYLALARFCRIVSEQATLERYLRRRGPALAAQGDLSQIGRERSLSVVVTESPHLFFDGDLFQEWPHAEGTLGLNPLYRRENIAGTGQIRLRRQFPDAEYERENEASTRYLPEELTVDRAVLESVETSSPRQVAELVDQFVLIDVPANY
jgi:ubiquinone/menaquinone biosynthesis C-methylase UbiE